MKWLLIFILLIPCVYAGNYTIGHQILPNYGETVNSNGYSLRFTSGLNEQTYKFNSNNYSARLGIFTDQQKFINQVINQTKQKNNSGGALSILVNKVNDCGLTAYAEKMTLGKRIRYVVMDKNNTVIESTLGGSKLFNYDNGTIKSKIFLVLTDNVYANAQTETCKAEIKIPIEKKTIFESWGILIAIISLILIILTRKRE